MTTIENIQVSAQNLFREKGFAATSMADLANTVGLKKASIYHYFDSKENILKEICFRIADEFFAELDELKNYKDITPDKLLRLAISGHIKVIVNNLDAAAVFFHEWRHLKEPTLSEFVELRNKYERYFVKIIKEGIQQKIFKDTNAKFIVLTIFSALNWTYEWYKPSGKMTPKDIAENLSNLLLKGLLN